MLRDFIYICFFRFDFIRESYFGLILWTNRDNLYNCPIHVIFWVWDGLKLIK